MTSTQGEKIPNSSPFIIPDIGGIELKKIAPPVGGGGGKGQPDFINSGNNRGRDIFGRLFFNTGGLWLLGYSAGGVFGAVEGYRTAVNPKWRIRVNSVVNAVSKRGSRIGNSLGIIGMFQ